MSRPGLDVGVAPACGQAVGRGRAGDVVNLPNVITFARLCLVPVAIWLALHGRFGWTVAVFAVAGISDAADGFLARRRGGTALGALLDPLADKALLVGMFVTLGAMGVLPNWLAVLVVLRDLLILGGIATLWSQGQPVRTGPLPIGKLNTAVQIAVVFVALLLAALSIDAPGASAVLACAAALTTVLSGVAYVRRTARAP